MQLLVRLRLRGLNIRRYVKQSGVIQKNEASDDALGGINRVNQLLNAGITTDLWGMRDFIWKISAKYGGNTLDLPPDH